jgi:membrane associated rhomboid family serine protease
MYVLSIVICPFVLFLLAIVLSGLLQYTVSDYLPLVSSNSSYAYLTTFAFLMPGEQFRLPRASKLKYRHTFQGRIHDFKLGGAYLKKLRRAEGGANIFGVFRVKNHDFTPKVKYA